MMQSLRWFVILGTLFIKSTRSLTNLKSIGMSDEKLSNFFTWEIGPLTWNWSPKLPQVEA